MRILIADDDPDIRQSLALSMTDWGYEVIEAGDGVQAVQILLSEDPPRLAVLDGLMPGLDGFQVCREIRGQLGRPYIYTVMLTALGDKQHLIEGLEAGADDYQAKLIDPSELRARLNTGRRIVSEQDALIAERESLRQRATHDSLTGLWNRAAILEILDKELSRHRREGASVGILMADLDHFKQINDTHGHLAGDAVLREAGRRIRSGLRAYDAGGRYGGEEFLLVLPGCGLEQTAEIGERLRRRLGEQPLAVPQGLIAVTISLGATATGTGRGDDAESLLQAADVALYRAKKGGRNRLETACRADRVAASHAG